MNEKYKVLDLYENDLSKQLDNLSHNENNKDTVWIINGKIETIEVSDEEFTNSNDIVSFDTMMSATVSQPDPRKPFKCNFSFNINFDIKLKLPNLNAPAPNYGLLYKIDEFADEISKINDDIIRAIQSMGCCDVAEAYNKTVVPLFRWFADHKDVQNCSDDNPDGVGCGPIFGGDTFPSILLNIAEVLIKIYLIVRPLVCLLRPLPGNPWFPIDFDILAPVRWVVAFFDLYYDKIISGKIMDLMINPVKDIRKKIDVCLFGGNLVKDSEVKDAEDRIISTINKDIFYKKILKEKEKELNKLQAKLESVNENIALNNEKNIQLFKTFSNLTISELLTYYNNDIDILQKVKYYATDEVTKQTCEMILQSTDEDRKTVAFQNILDNTTLDTVNIPYKTVVFNDWAESNFSMINDALYITSASSKIKTSTISDPIEKYKRLSNLDIDVYDYFDDLTFKYAYTTIDRIISGQPNLIPFNNDVAVDSSDSVGYVIDTKIFTQYFIGIAKIILDLYIQKNKLLRDIQHVKNFIDNIIAMIKTSDNKNNFINISESEKYTYLLNKYGRVSNICDCFYAGVMASFGLSGYIPLPAKVKDFYQNGFIEVEGYEDVFIKYKDFGSKKDKFIKTTLELDFKTQYLSNNDPSEFYFYYSKKFTKIMSEEYKININKLHNDFSDYNNEVNINKIKIKGDYSPDFLDVLDSKYGVELFTSFKFENETVKFKSIEDRSMLYDFGIDDTDISDDTDNIEKSIELPVLKLNYVPSMLKPSDIYKHKIILEKYKKSIYSNLSKWQSSYDNLMKKDEGNFYNAKAKAKSILNSSKINPNISDDILNFNVDQKIASDLYQEFFGSYHKINLINDPRDLVVRHYLNDDNTYSENSASGKIQECINNYITGRTSLINNNSEIFLNLQFFKDELNKIINYENSSVRLSSIYSPWVFKKPNIPCQCDFFCKLIQTIINALLSLLNKLIQYIIGLIMDWFWKTPIGKLIKFLIAKIKCVMMIINFKDDWQNLQDLTDRLQEGLKHNIKLFKDISNCTDNDLVPPPPPNFLTIDEIENLMDSNNSNDDSDSDSGDDSTNTIVENSDGSVTITGDNGDEIILPSSKLPDKLEPVITKPTKSLPATLVISTGIELGSNIIYPDHSFPLLTFGGPDCMTCTDNEIKKENTLEFINS